MQQNKLYIEAEKVCGEIEEFIRYKVEELHAEGVVMGLSGGLDSSVVVFLASRAIGPKSVLCLSLPEKHSSSEGQLHAQLVADKLGVNFEIEDLTSKLNNFGIYKLIPDKIPDFLIKRAFKHYSEKMDGPPFSPGSLDSRSKITNTIDAFYRIKHRMRMLTLYYHGEMKNLLVAGAANKTEFLIGFLVRYGCDDLSDIMPIRNLYKTQVRQLAKYLGVPAEIIDKPPSPDLIPGITDEYAIGLPYETLDLILYGLEKSMPHDEIANQYKCKVESVEYVAELVKRAKHIREAPWIPASK